MTQIIKEKIIIYKNKEKSKSLVNSKIFMKYRAREKILFMPIEPRKVFHLIKKINQIRIIFLFKKIEKEIISLQ